MTTHAHEAAPAYIPFSGDHALDLIGMLEQLRLSIITLTDFETRADRMGLSEVRPADWAAGGSFEYDYHGKFHGFFFSNPSAGDVTISTAPNKGARGAGEILVPAGSWITLPQRGSHLSIGGAAAGTGTLAILEVAPEPAMGRVTNISPGTQTVDLTDRIARLVGRVARGIADSLNAGGTVVAPGAAAAIATTGAGVTGGVYEIVVSVAVGAGALAADLGNLRLQEGATVLAVLAVPAPGGVSFGPIRRTNVGNSAYSVNAVAAGTAAVPYAATIAATRIE